MPLSHMSPVGAWRGREMRGWCAAGCGRGSAGWLAYDLGQATGNMMLAAADLGIGSGHSAVADQEQAQRVLGFPDGYLARYLIGLGYPADRPLRPIASPSRRPFDEVVHWSRW